ncbi:MAG: hypothetical protein A2785_02245 [Candidatus Chisholmbacteria bacterium RIFCSPHIGHO2_01_FULL_49_18]|uniref:Glycosyl transferase family 1 domain-containing protein n=2 Tax=Candidatus Chisholmiibacteriota TaxID=1817900 RepID=A0A1G1VNL2_9BACT|nr:MAG: hypothetical protein A2785_02245 [Candidatus Chisholmbacteria bacterium RIFCSPHIGHO2_01_FULL_49_18]OGY21540.1 MAG: hypothetical protein A3A65_05460 [Candidatus Chisholmbacteria bacterium RIFCSPLOWO2_01_FULL_49_14]
MNILMTSWRDRKNPAAGGAEVLTHEIARRLNDRGHKITLITGRFPGGKEQDDDDGVRILRPAYFSPTNAISYVRWISFLLATLVTYKREEAGIDVVIEHVHGLPMLISVFAKKPVFLFPHEVANDIWFMEVPFPGNVLGFVLERVYLSLFRNFPFLVNSPSTAADVRAHGIKRIFTITPGISKPPRTLQPKNPRPTFIVLGRITPMKRLQAVVDGVSKLGNRQVLLHIVGGGKPRPVQNLVLYVRKTGMSGQVRFHGFVGEKRKFDLLSQSWALLSTSLREGWGINVLEAASVGTPTIAYRVPGIRDSVVNGKTGILVSPNSAALASALQTFMRDQKLRESLSRNARSHSQKFTWDRTTDEFLKAIATVRTKTKEHTPLHY